MHKDKKIREFNILIVGTGGQGQITLLNILAEAALFDGLDFKSSELHGLSQRGGSVQVHIRFGKKIYSPMIEAGKADLILGLEMQESLTALNFAGPQTKFLINKIIIPIPSAENLNEEQVLSGLKKINSNIYLVSAEKICQQEIGSKVVAGTYLISLAAFKKLIPINPNFILKAIKKIIPKKYLEINLKTFELASKNYNQ